MCRYAWAKDEAAGAAGKGGGAGGKKGKGAAGGLTPKGGVKKSKGGKK